MRILFYLCLLTYISLATLNASEDYPIETLESLKIPLNTPLDSIEAWQNVPLREIKSGEILVARVGAAHDGTNLYLVYLVEDSSPLKNRGQDPWNHYKEGDNCDLMIGAYRSPGGTVAEGDLRLLFTPAEPPVVTVYRQMMKGADPDFRVEFKSPVRAIWMDFVAPLDDIKIVFGLREGGYFCVAQVPFDKISVNYSPGLKVLFDMGVLSSNDGGILTERRAYLYNKKANVVMDVPTEAELTPAEWGTAILK